MINFLDLSIREEQQANVIRRISDVMSSGQYILGKYTEQFEASICEYLGARYCVGENSGYDALELALRACGIGIGDEVITVANTFVATVSAIIATGAKPVLIDVDNTRNMNPHEIEKHINPSTKAILPVHLAGIPCEMDLICSIAERYGLLVIEDAAQAFGTKFDGRYAGTFGICGCFSLHPTKILGGCGDGGMIVTNNEELNKELRLIRNHGLEDRNHVSVFGYNSRLDEIQSCFLLERMSTVDEEIRKRREYATEYNNALKDLDIELPQISQHSYATFFTYTIMTNHRNELKNALFELGIDTRIHYPIPINHQPAYTSAYGELSLLNTDTQAERILSLPCNGSLTLEDIHYIIQCMRESLCAY